MIEFLYDTTMDARTREYSFSVDLYPVVASSFTPLQIRTALDGAYATWLLQDGWVL